MVGTGRNKDYDMTIESVFLYGILCMKINTIAY